MSDILHLDVRWLSTNVKMALRIVKQYTVAFWSGCVLRVDSQLAAITAVRNAFDCDVLIHLFHQNKSAWKAALRF